MECLIHGHRERIKGHYLYLWVWMLRQICQELETKSVVGLLIKKKVWLVSDRDQLIPILTHWEQVQANTYT